MMVVSVFLPPMFGETNFENRFFGDFKARMFIPYALGEDSHLMTTITLVEMMQFHQLVFSEGW